jgi:hypothetical protein
MRIKSYAFAIIFTMIHSIGYSQLAVPTNYFTGDFETWTTDFYPKPQYWSIGTQADCGNAYQGNYCLRLINQANVGKESQTEFLVPTQGFPTKLKGKIKYNFSPGSKGTIIISLADINLQINSTTTAVVSIPSQVAWKRFSGNTNNNWIDFEIPIDYRISSSAYFSNKTFKHMRVEMASFDNISYSFSSEDKNIKANDYIAVDNLSFSDYITALPRYNYNLTNAGFDQWLTIDSSDYLLEYNVYQGTAYSSSYKGLTKTADGLNKTTGLKITEANSTQRFNTYLFGQLIYNGSDKYLSFYAKSGSDLKNNILTVYTYSGFLENFHKDTLNVTKDFTRFYVNMQNYTKGDTISFNLQFNQKDKNASTGEYVIIDEFAFTNTVAIEKDELLNEVLVVYPNPVVNELNISKEINYSISNMYGQPITSGFGNTINTSTFSKGMYLLQYQNRDNKIITKTFVKE